MLKDVHASLDEFESILVERLRNIIKRDPFKMRCLRALQMLDLPQGYIGAGFVRNAIWDELHEKSTPTPLNDIDVIYFSSDTRRPPTVVAQHANESLPKTAAQSKRISAEKALEQKIECELARLVPDVSWQVKNQARMHVAHNHAPYKSCYESISYWIERETCVAVKLTANDGIDILAPFGLVANFAGTISINPKYPRPDVFNERVASKSWLNTWPQLKIVK
ncbi:nucleotidyltransferase family protein [Alteromonas sp. KUL106]|uniref:nucleotidyltransferase family protein n=1 Tax=Alteromonas sp. KUL106 TaxID=2480799 RepID=UPI0012E589ED|nr:nucleotidyltransferase family protein [Alteromonas sp. KUL106]GFD67562.1 nitrate reductase [Alteromonas sp. KUL106]